MEVINYEIEYTRPDKFPLYPLGDMHLGVVHCDEDLLDKEVLKIKADKNARWLGMGDYGDYISPSDFKRWEGAILAPWMRKHEDNIGPTQTDRINEILSPIWGQCIGLIEGNHEDCFDSETEILTVKGWAKFESLNVGDTIVTLNPETRLLENQPIESIHIYDHDGSMLRYNLGNISLFITPNHRIVYRNGKSELRIAEATKMEGNFPSFPLASTYQLKGYGDITLGEIALAAWYITDGYERCFNGVSFSQRKSNSWRIKKSLSHSGWKYTSHIRNRKTQEICGKKLKSPPEPEEIINISGEYGKRLKELVPNKHHLPYWVSLLSKSQFAYFLNAYMKGDGTPSRSVIYGTKEILDELQIACITHGYKATLTQYRQGSWRLNINPKRHLGTYWSSVRTFAFKEEYYKGKVYCASVPNGTLFVRRDGKPIITGNSIRRFHHYNAMEELLKRANKKHKVPYAGVSCFVRILFKRGTESHEFIIHARHGEGAARTSGARALAVLRLSQSMVNAHITLMGHLHGQESPDIPQRLILKGGKIKSFETIATMTGAWIRAYMQGVPPCYLERWGSPPSTLGCPRIILYPNTGEMILEKSRTTLPI